MIYREGNGEWGVQKKTDECRMPEKYIKAEESLRNDKGARSKVYGEKNAEDRLRLRQRGKQRRAENGRHTSRTSMKTIKEDRRDQGYETTNWQKKVKFN